MKTYADQDFYKSSYLLGRTPKIPNQEFSYWSMLASGMIRQSTFKRIDDMEHVPEEVQMCCCEAAEKLYMAESAKDENGLVLQSYENDGDKGVYKTDEISELQVMENIDGIIKRWLIHTGLMDYGVI